MLETIARDLRIVLPLTVLIVWALALLVVDLFIPRGRKGITALLAAAGLALSLGLDLPQLTQNNQAFGGMVIVDGFGAFQSVLFMAGGLLGIALAYDYLKRTGIERGEYYALLLFSVAGMVLMSYAADLIVVFLALELLSIPLYIMAGFARPRVDSEESALKYFLLGSFASGFVLYGVALLFGATARTDLAGIIATVREGVQEPVLLLIGAALLLVGFAFKIAVVPFHMWTPDVYHGAPTSVTAFMSYGAKVAGFTALLRVFLVAFPSLSAELTPILWALAALTMVVGNVLAISQTNIKRMLAYSSIAHAGYLLMAFVPYGQGQVVSNSIASVLFYLAAYGLANFAAWSVVIAREQPDARGLELADYAGLAKKSPLMAAVMAVAMLSFTGIPPTLGLWGKLYLFRTTIEGGFVGLAIIGLLASLVSAYYYLRVIVMMYMREGEPEVHADTWVALAGVASAAALVLLSLFPGGLFRLAQQVLLNLM